MNIPRKLYRWLGVLILFEAIFLSLLTELYNYKISFLCVMAGYIGGLIVSK